MAQNGASPRLAISSREQNGHAPSCYLLPGAKRGVNIPHNILHNIPGRSMRFLFILAKKLIVRPSKIEGAKRAAPEENARPPGAAPIFLWGRALCASYLPLRKKSGVQRPAQNQSPRVANEKLSSSYRGGWRRVARGWQDFYSRVANEHFAVVMREGGKGWQTFFLNNK